MSGNDADRESAQRGTDKRLHLVLRYGRTATAFRTVGVDLHVWYDPDGEGMVAYAAPPGAMVSAGEPVAALESLVPLAEAFVHHAEAQGKRPSFFATEGRLASSVALQRLLIGEQPVWNPQRWADHVAAHRSLREQIRRARAKGVTVCPLGPDALAAGDTARDIDALLARWRATRSMATMQFLVTIDLTSGGAARRHLVAMQHGRLVAMLSLAPVPARNGWLFEHLLRDPDAPNGTLELLVDHAMREVAREGAEWATLGLAPLHGDVTPWLRRLRRWSTPLFNFEGLSAFKRKLRPDTWEPIYLAWPKRASMWRAVLDGLRAFAGGSLLYFGARTMLRGPSPLLAALQWLLVPWTMALALMPTAPWFPSVAVHAAWVVFDGALLLALRELRQGARLHDRASRRRVSMLASTVAAAVSVDVLLTTWQALSWNAPALAARHAPLEEWMVLWIACAGPLIAAPVLWGTAARLRVLATR